MKDNFSGQAGVYARYRPTYPQELYDFILNRIEKRNTAWDCGTGNGQTAKELARYFENVFATDISEKQIQHAHGAENIFYSVQPAEQTNFADNTFDLVTVSQALHWFDVNKFYTEAKRVAKPGAWVAAWMYSLANISPEIDELINVKHYRKTLRGYWDYERRYVDENYMTLPFPFKEIQCPVFEIKAEWTLEELKGYLNSWSALQKFIIANHFNPVDGLAEQIKPFWHREKMEILFPVHMKMGKIEK
jgi:ubiquinone/menaquinone biosynthesis C-methylase UbiE